MMIGEGHAAEGDALKCIVRLITRIIQLQLIISSTLMIVVLAERVERRECGAEPQVEFNLDVAFLALAVEVYGGPEVGREAVGEASAEAIAATVVRRVGRAAIGVLVDLVLGAGKSVEVGAERYLMVGARFQAEQREVWLAVLLQVLAERSEGPVDKVYGLFPFSDFRFYTEAITRRLITTVEVTAVSGC